MRFISRITYVKIHLCDGLKENLPEGSGTIRRCGFVEGSVSLSMQALRSLLLKLTSLSVTLSILLVAF